jgi:hypothetical protein
LVCAADAIKLGNQSYHFNVKLQRLSALIKQKLFTAVCFMLISCLTCSSNMKIDSMNMTVMRIFGLKEEEIRGGWRKMLNGELLICIRVLN